MVMELVSGLLGFAKTSSQVAAATGSYHRCNRRRLLRGDH